MTDPATKSKVETGAGRPTSDGGLSQSERFIKTAQELGTDDDPERFAERVKRLAKRRSEHEPDATIPSTKR